MRSEVKMVNQVHWNCQSQQARDVWMNMGTTKDLSRRNTLWSQSKVNRILRRAWCGSKLHFIFNDTFNRRKVILLQTSAHELQFLKRKVSLSRESNFIKVKPWFYFLPESNLWNDNDVKSVWDNAVPFSDFPTSCFRGNDTFNRRKGILLQTRLKVCWEKTEKSLWVVTRRWTVASASPY